MSKKKLNIKVMFRDLFLNKETSRQIHDARSEFTGKAHQSIQRTNKTRKRIEQTTAYKMIISGKI